MIFCRLFVRLLLLAACASAPLALAAGNYNTTDITVGTTVITIPAPKEFALLPPEAQPYFEWITRFITPNSEQFAVFLSEADVANAKQGGMPDSRGRMFRVQTTKQLIPISFTRAQFTKFKSALKAQNESMLKEVEAEMPGVVGKIIKEISDSHKVNLGDFGLSTVQMMQLPPHDDTERKIAYSMLFALQVKDSDGQAMLNEGVATLTYVHIKGKVICLYVNAEKLGLEWSRSAAKQWVEAVIVANPSNAETAAKEAEPQRSWFDWGSVVKDFAVWGLIGVIIALVRWQIKRH